MIRSESALLSSSSYCFGPVADDIYDKDDPFDRTLYVIDSPAETHVGCGVWLEIMNVELDRSREGCSRKQELKGYGVSTALSSLEVRPEEYTPLSTPIASVH